MHQHRYEVIGSHFEFVILKCMECGDEFEDPCDANGMGLEDDF